MTYPNRIQNPSPQDYSSYDSGDFGGAYDVDSNADTEGVYGDEQGFGLSDDSQVGGVRPLTGAQAQKRLDDLLKTLTEKLNTEKSLTPDEKKQVQSEISQIKTLKRSLHAPNALVDHVTLSKISALEALVYGASVGEDNGDGDSDQDSADTKKQALELKGKIEKLNIPAEEKDKLKSELESFLTLANKGNTDEDSSVSLEDIQKKVDLYSKHSSAVIQLAQELTDGSSEEGPSGVLDKSPTNTIPDENVLKNIEAIFKKHGIELNSLPNPPTPELLEALTEISPTFAGKCKEVKDLTKARQDFIQDSLTKANTLNTTNSSNTSDNDNQDVVKYAQNLYDAKYFQDDNSQKLTKAQQEAVQTLKPLLQSLYGNSATVEAVKPQTDAVIWKNQYNEAIVADQIKVGGSTIDLFNIANGSLQANSAADTEKVETVTVQYDNEGSGKWIATGTGYGEDFKSESYDNGGSIVGGIWHGVCDFVGSIF